MSTRLSEFETTVSRVPYLLNNEYIGGYLGQPQLRGENESKVVAGHMHNRRLASLPRFAVASKTLREVGKAHLPKFGVMKINGNTEIFAYDDNTKIVDVLEDVLSKPWPRQNNPWMPNVEGKTYFEVYGQYSPRQPPVSHIINVNAIDRGIDVRGKVADLTRDRTSGIVELEHRLAGTNIGSIRIGNRQGVVPEPALASQTGMLWLLPLLEF